MRRKRRADRGRKRITRLLAAQFLVVAATFAVGDQAAAAAAPTVLSIDRADPNPTNADTVHWTVTFSQSVSGVDTSDFQLVPGGGAAGTSITGVTGSAATYTVTTNAGTHDGTLGLNLIDDDTIQNGSSEPLGGAGAGNGNFTGQIYTIDRTAPAITLDAPAHGATTSDSTPPFSGSTNDVGPVVVTISGPVNESLPATRNATTWTASANPSLPDGTYVAAARQTDSAGNVGTSAAHTFTVNTAPRASFGYTPSSPLTGDTITLFSTSSDPNGPIARLEWDLKDDGKFADATGPTATVSFATAGTHRVLLRATNAQGASSVAEAIITLGWRPIIPTPVVRPALMSPFPVVRIAGSFSSSGARLRVLQISAPKSARIDVACRGAGCPRKRQSKVASLGPVARSAQLVRFGRFEHTLHGGVVLEIRITQTGRIGKYTRFTVRRNRAPLRIDRCLMPGKRTPVTCPSQ